MVRRVEKRLYPLSCTPFFVKEPYVPVVLVAGLQRKRYSPHPPDGPSDTDIADDCRNIAY